MSEKSAKGRARTVEIEPKKEAWWCSRPRRIEIPRRPELALFPTLLSWHYGNYETARPYKRCVFYYPLFFSLRAAPENRGLQMRYQSFMDPDAWIIFTAGGRPLKWTAEKYVQEKPVGTTIGPADDMFFMHLAFMPIPDNEKHDVSAWPPEEIADMRAPGGSKVPPDPDLTDVCSRLVGAAARAHAINRTEAANMIIAILSGELLARPDGLWPS